MTFNAEATNRHVSAAGCPLLINVRLEALGVGGSDTALPLAPLLPFERAPILRDIGVEEHISLVADIHDRQLHILEEHREGPQRFRIWLPGMTFRDGHYEPFHVNNVDYTVSQGDWIAILEQVGYARRFLVELEVPSLEPNPNLAEAVVSYFLQARRRYLEGEWRHCVESLRQCVAAIVEKTEDEDDMSDVQIALKNANKAKITGSIGYAARVDLTRQALKFYGDLGAHPEVAETHRNDARAAMTMVHGLLDAYSEHA